ncbi:MAG: hypothetical protein OXI80_19350 [Caldilineaceae bacterium]|nr:hypothetical protein [Caldilineaceae bacterium]
MERYWADPAVLASLWLEATRRLEYPPFPRSSTRIYTAPDHGYNGNVTDAHMRKPIPWGERQD